MSLPLFYSPGYDPGRQEVILDEDNSRHIVQVLRMKRGDLLRLTNGRGALLTAEIIEDHKKKCCVAIRSATPVAAPEPRVTIAISPLKNASRFEWFVEKATEIGVTGIIPLVCDRTERTTARMDRLQQIAVSAMLQSQQGWLPRLADPMPFSELIRSNGSLPDFPARYIAHCLGTPRPTASLGAIPHPSATGGFDPATTRADRSASLILIGPEGDFSPGEVDAALTAGFVPVTLGSNRLRTETAGVVAAALLCIG
ncbi:MAG TPA: RsmE family RNA methyltransferase [Puia sp.]|nr:RsmE family RNA methyltransferase [Puia sp.]